jgi:hypothetical protein
MKKKGESRIEVFFIINATDKQRNNIEIICGGIGLHWPDLDEDLSVTGIIKGRFGY